MAAENTTAVVEGPASTIATPPHAAAPSTPSLPISSQALSPSPAASAASYLGQLWSSAFSSAPAPVGSGTASSPAGIGSTLRLTAADASVSTSGRALVETGTAPSAVAAVTAVLPQPSVDSSADHEPACSESVAPVPLSSGDPTLSAPPGRDADVADATH
jgi:hypothetical protein